MLPVASLAAFCTAASSGDINLARGFVEFVDVDGLLDREVIATLCGPQLLLVSELACERLVNFPVAAVIRVAP